MKRSLALACLFLAVMTTGCMAARTAGHQIKKAQSKASNTYHAKSYSKALRANAPQLVGTWSKIETFGFSKIIISVTHSTLSLFSDGTYASKSHRYQTAAGFVQHDPTPAQSSSLPPAGIGLATTVVRRYPPYPTSSKLGVDTSRGDVTSGRGTWRKTGPNTIELTHKNSSNLRTVDLSQWTSQQAGHHDWLERGAAEQAPDPDPIPRHLFITPPGPTADPDADGDSQTEPDRMWWNNAPEFPEWLKRHIERGSDE